MNGEKIKEFFASVTLQKILPAIAILVLGFLIVKLVLKLIDRAMDRSKLDKTAFSIVRVTLRVLLYLLVLLIAAASLGIDVSSLIAIVSVVSLAISLAVQNLLSNLVGGVTLLAAHPFHVGDYVQVGADSGIVKEIGLHYTKISTFDGELIYIPNSETVSCRIRNFTVEGKRRVVIPVSAAYHENMQQVKELILQAAKHEKALTDPAPHAVVSECADSSVNYQLFLWVKAEDYLDVKFAVTEEIKRLFDEKGISIPFPQLDVHMSRE